MNDGCDGGISNARARSLLLFDADDDEDAAADDDAEEDEDEEDDGSGASGRTNVVDAGKCSRLGLCTSLMIGCNALSPKCSWIS